MIGNDIIDLKAAAAESDPLRAGFINKVFTHSEQEIIEEAEDKTLTVWILWAMKEAAYKAHQRRFDLPRYFNPKQMDCKIYKRDSASVSGVVNIQQHTYFSSVTLAGQFLHATASPVAQESPLIKIYPSSLNIKEEFLKEFSSLKNLPKNLLRIIKNKNQVPVLQFNDRNMDYPFSLSHHGDFSAFSLSLTNY